jgi:uncharacterized protein (TIGR02996 family)
LTSDRDALFAAVRAAPDDDLPRLVFADWLDETGHPANAARAAYIRLQVDAEGHPPGSSDRLELTRRAEELRPSFKDEWDQAFEPGDLAGVTAVRRRGFVDEVQAPIDRTAGLGGPMLDAAPVRTLRLAPGEWDTAIGASAWVSVHFRFLSRIATLQLGPYLGGLAGRSRAYVGFGPTPPVAAALLASPWPTALRRLELSGNDLDDEWVVWFAPRFKDAVFVRTLVELDLSGNQITDAGAFTLYSAPRLDGLRLLKLTGNRVTPGMVPILRRRFGDRVVV